LILKVVTIRLRQRAPHFQPDNLAGKRNWPKEKIGIAYEARGFACDADVKNFFVQERRRPVSATAMPAITATAPPMISHMERSVGLPVKVRETSEVNECDSLNPKTSSTMPSARIPKPTILFMVFPFFLSA